MRILGGSRLAGDGDAGKARGAPRAPIVRHDAAERLADDLDGPPVDGGIPFDRRSETVHDRAVGVDDLLHDVRLDARAAVRDAGRHGAELHGSRQYLPLPDREVEHQPLRPPALAEPPVEIRLVGHHARHLARQIDAGFPAETEETGDRGELVDIELLAELVEIRVARLDERVAEGERAVSPRLPAAEVPVAEPHSAGARALVGIRVDAPVHEGGVRGHRLEDGAGRIRGLYGAVEHRPLGILEQLPPPLAAQSLDEHVRIVDRTAHHGEDLPRARIHGDEGAARPFERLLRRPLQREIDREMDVATRDARPGSAETFDFVAVHEPGDLPHLPPLDADADDADAVDAAQVPLVHRLEPRSPDDVPAFQPAGPADLLIRRLADVAEEVRGERALGEVASRPHRELEEREELAILAQDRDLLLVRGLDDRHLPPVGVPLHPRVEIALHLRRIEPQPLAGEREELAPARRPVRQDADLVDGRVDDELLAVSRADDSPRRRNALPLELIGVRELREMIVADDLKPEEADDERRHDADEYHRKRAAPRIERGGVSRVKRAHWTAPPFSR